MALTLITEGNTSSANDLNQIVNLLNGTTTNTQVTVNGPISAQLSPAAAPMRYVGGRAAYPTPAIFNFLFTTVSDAPWPTDFDGGGTFTGTYYKNGDLTWTTQGGPIGVYNYVTNNGIDSVPVGTSGYVCRVHQAGAVTVSTTAQTIVTGDTIDFDPRGMVKPSITGSGIAIQIPFNGIWGIAAAVHGSGVNSINNSWFIEAFGNAFTNSAGPPGVQISSAQDNTHKYTGTVICGTFQAGPGMQLGLTCFASAPVAYNLDVSGPDRTYISVWHVG